MTSAISVKDRLKRRAVASGKTMQDALTAYGLESLLYVKFRMVLGSLFLFW